MVILLGTVWGGAATCSQGFVSCFLRHPQAVGLYYSCHAAQASQWNFQKTYYKQVSAPDCKRIDSFRGIAVRNSCFWRIGSPLFRTDRSYERDQFSRCLPLSLAVRSSPASDGKSQCGELPKVRKNPVYQWNLPLKSSCSSLVGFCTAEFWSLLAYESAEQKHKHCLT